MVATISRENGRCIATRLSFLGFNMFAQGQTVELLVSFHHAQRGFSLPVVNQKKVGKKFEIQRDHWWSI